jgi:putative ABC transport system permease protein
MRRFSMFARILLRATWVRRGRAFIVVFALVVAAATATALLTLYADVDAKLHREFRNFGANLVATAKPGQPMPVNEVLSVLHAGDFAVPYAYAIAKLPDGRPVVVAGTFVSKARRLNPGWKVIDSVDPEAPLIGKRVLGLVGSGPLVLRFAGREQVLTQYNILETGAAEDDRIYMPLHAFLAWTGLQVNTVEISIAGGAEQIAAAEHRIAAAFPDVDIRPVRQLIEAETNVLQRSRSVFYSVSLLIMVLVGFCVLAAFTSSVLERRRDFALMKALGCSQRMLAGLFMVEAALVAVIGSIVGFGLGMGIAYAIGRANFHTAVVLRPAVFPPVLAGCILIAALGALLPLQRLRSIQPAVMLKGD